MKKLVATISIVVVIGIGIIFGTIVVLDAKQSVQEYLANDLVVNPEIMTEDNSDQDSKDQTNSKTEDEIPSSLDEINASAASARDSLIMSEKGFDSSEDSLSETENSSTNAEDNLDKKDNKTNLTNSKDSQTEDSQTENSVEVEDESAIEVALNIVNPSIEVAASSAILLNVKTGKVLFHKNATTAVYPASTTKLLTALVALDLCDVSDEVTIGDEVSLIASDSSRAYLVKGEKLTLQMLLEGMLVPSGNDAAYATAAYVGRVSLENKKANAKTAIKEFIRLMNAKCEELGLKNSHFKNPDGYDEEGQYTTAYDMGTIAMEALKNDTICNIATKSHARNIFLSGEDVTWNSSNKLIVSGSGKYYKYAIGLKTGTSSLAGRCLVSAAEKGDCRYVSVIMNSSATGRWDDSIALLEYGIEE